MEKLSLKIASLGITTVLVFLATAFFSVYIPATKGFFNIGESMVYLSSILFGPFIGAFAGGVGSMLADLYLGYYYYAPATLIIKALEGFSVGFLIKYSPKLNRSRWRLITSFLGLLAGALLATIGSTYYSGNMELTLGQATFTLYIPEVFWLTLASLTFIIMLLAGLILEPALGWSILSIIAGGLIMVLGYFVYEMYFLGWLFGIEAIAIAEVPFNIGQMTIGLIIAAPTSKAIQKILHLKAK
jgi:uncharacterized membrane protein